MEALRISYAHSFGCAEAGGKPASNQARAAFAALWDNSPPALRHGPRMSAVGTVNVSLAVDVLRHGAVSGSQTFMGSEFLPGTPGFPVKRAAPNFSVPRPLPTRPPASCQALHNHKPLSDILRLSDLTFTGVFCTLCMCFSCLHICPGKHP